MYEKLKYKTKKFADLLGVIFRVILGMYFLDYEIKNCPNTTIKFPPKI